MKSQFFFFVLFFFTFMETGFGKEILIIIYEKNSVKILNLQEIISKAHCLKLLVENYVRKLYKISTPATIIKKL